MIITVWNNYSKRYNSTARPTGGTEITVNLKSPTSKETPVFELSAQNAFDINYVKWSDHYYFVSNVIYTAQGLYEIHCSEDKMATYRPNIFALTTLVKRTSAIADISIPDGQSVQRQKFKTTKTAFTTDTMYDQSGCYVLRATGIGGIRTYVMNEDTLTSILNYMYSDSIWNAAKNWANTMYNPFSHIVSVKWMPFSITNLRKNEVGTYVFLGNYNTGVEAYIAKSGISETFTLVIPESEYGIDFKTYSNSWTSLTTNLPGVGIINIDPQCIQKGIFIDRLVDVATGQVTYKLFYADDTPAERGLITSVTGAIAAEIQISNTQPNMAQFVSSAVGAIAGIGAAASGAAVASGIIGATTSVAESIKAVTSGTTSITGNNGNKIALEHDYIITTLSQLWESGNNVNDVAGKPMYAEMLLGDVARVNNHYVECYKPSINLAGLEDDRRFINNMLESGVYLD